MWRKKNGTHTSQNSHDSHRLLLTAVLLVAMAAAGSAATCTTVGAGKITDAGTWDALPGNGDIANVIHAVTIDRGGALPATGTLAELNLSAGASGALSVNAAGSGAIAIAAAKITGIERLTDTNQNAGMTLTCPDVQGLNKFTCRSPAATPLHITGNLTIVATTYNALAWGTGGKKLIVDGSVTLTSGADALLLQTDAALECDILITHATGQFTSGIQTSDEGAGTITCTTSCSGTADGTTGIGIEITSPNVTLTAPTITASGVNSASSGIIAAGTVVGNVTGQGAADAASVGVSIDGTLTGNATGSVLGAGNGVQVGNGLPATVTGDVLGTSVGGIGVKIGDGANASMATGNATGRGGTGGKGIVIKNLSALKGNINLTSDPTSGVIEIQAGGSWRDAAGTGAGKIVAAAGNTIKDGAGTEFCPTANVAPAAKVQFGAPRWTGATGADVGLLWIDR